MDALTVSALVAACIDVACTTGNPGQVCCRICNTAFESDVSVSFRSELCDHSAGLREADQEHSREIPTTGGIRRQPQPSSFGNIGQLSVSRQQLQSAQLSSTTINISGPLIALSGRQRDELVRLIKAAGFSAGDIPWKSGQQVNTFLDGKQVDYAITILSVSTQVVKCFRTLMAWQQLPCAQRHEWSAHSLHHYWNNKKLSPTDLARRINLSHGQQLIALVPHVCPL